MSEGVFQDLEKAILEYNKDLAVKTAAEIVEKKLDVMKALAVITDAARKVGQGFEKGDLWLPDLVGASEAMSGALPVLEEELKISGKKSQDLGTVVIGTVYGDIHTIGKTMVATLLTAEGFRVYDVGINVTSEAFVEAVKVHNADILAMSALMTTTAPEQKKAIESLKKEGIRDRVKVMVGGGGVTHGFAETIGADGYDPTAPGAAKLARRLLGR